MEKKIEKWTRVNSEYLMRRPWLTARRDTVCLPDGRVNPEYYVIERPKWINVIAVTADGRFVMVEQYRHALEDVFTEIVAGVVEPGESPEKAARRELLEETGFGGGEWRLLTVVGENPSTSTNLTYCWLAENVERMADQHLDATEDIGVKLMSRVEVLRLLEEDMVKQALMAAPLWKYFYMTK